MELALDLEIPLLKAVRLVAKVPAALEQPVEEVAARVQATARSLGVSAEVQVDLYVAQPSMWQISQPSIIKDR